MFERSEIKAELVSEHKWPEIKDEIMHIEKEVFGEKGETEREMKEAFNNSTSIVVILKNKDKIIGYEVAVDPEPEEESIHISAIAILPEFQGQGFVSSLLKLACEEAKRRNIKYFTTTARIALVNIIRRHYEIIEEMPPEDIGLGLQQDLKFIIP